MTRDEFIRKIAEAYERGDVLLDDEGLDSFYEELKKYAPDPDRPPRWVKARDQDEECTCGHPYYRHFDTYEEMSPVGCKYCPCPRFHYPEEGLHPDVCPSDEWGGQHCVNMNFEMTIGGVAHFPCKYCGRTFTYDD